MPPFLRSVLVLLVLGGMMPLALSAQETISSATRTGLVDMPAVRGAEQARQVAETWVELVDRGRYSASYDAAGDKLQGEVSKKRWFRLLHGARNPLGTVNRRQIQRVEMEGSPDDPRLFFHYHTNFDRLSDIHEIIEVERDRENVWRVASYTLDRL